jgi:hypothetical protein
VRPFLLPLLALTLLSLCIGPQASAQAATLYPVDEAAQQPEFFSFRARLLQALQARDTTVLYAALDPNIRNSFGGDGGVEEFRQKWRPAAEDAEVWTVLTEILSLGGAFYHDSLFVGPYTTSSFPDHLDGFEHVAIVGSNVRARRQPSLDADVVATLSFDVVRLDAEAYGRPGDDRWLAVRLADGTPAYVWAAYARSPIGYRAVFERRDGRWLLRALVAGD